MITFIHTADLHLDSPFKGIKQLEPQLFDAIYQSTFDSFRELVTQAIAAEVDFFLISGDIYDEENQSVKAQAFLRDELGQAGSFRYPGLFVAWEPRFSRKGSTQTAASGKRHGLRKRGHD